MSDTVQTIKERLSIVDVVSPYVKLTKAGKYYKGLCPFHKEKTPSFMVSSDRGFYHCFGCNRGGDMFTFIEEMERVDFRGALKLLAEKAGVPLVYEKTADKDARERLYAVLEDANAFFVAHLARHADARGYLTSRGLKSATLEHWSLGYAPNEWRALGDHLLTKGFTELEMDTAGLLKRKEGASRRYDTFRGRIMFPIRDASGRTVAFTGRAFGETENSGQAKYLNSPETQLFEKSKVLYGIDLAKEGIRRLGFAILVEGQIDLLAAHQAGYVNALALSGTAFTEDHARLVQRHTENLVLAFDGDQAGVEAAGRAASLALSAGLNTKIAALPLDEDPAELIRRDPKAWKEAVRDAVHVIDFYLSYISDSGHDPRRARLEASRIVLPYVAALGNEIDRAHFIQRVAESLGIPEDAVRAEVKKLTSRSFPAGRTADPAREPARFAEPFLSRGGSLERLLFGVADALAPGDPVRAASIQRVLGASAELSPEDRRAALIEGDLFLERFPEPGARGAAIDDLILDFTKERSRDRYRATVALLKEAERSGDSTRVASLMHELAMLAKNL